MLKAKIKRNKSLVIIGSLLIFIGISIIGIKYIYNFYLDNEEEIKIKEFYEEQETIQESQEISNEENINQEETIVEDSSNYIAVIKIPKIELEKGLCSKDSYCNNVNKNIIIMNESTYPDIEKGNFILAGHAGYGRVSYFRNLYKLSLDDEVYIYYQGKEYKYKVVNMYDIEKTGTAHIVRNNEKTTLTLITCRYKTNKQIIIICELVD